MLRKILFIAVVLTTFVLSGCSNDYINSISLSSLEVEEGETFKLFMNVENPHRTYKNFSFDVYFEDDLIEPYQYSDTSSPFSFDKLIPCCGEDRSYYVNFFVKNISKGREVTSIYVHVNNPEGEDNQESDFILMKKKPKDCYNSTYKKYNGKINDTCYFFGCESECKEDMVRQMEWDSLRWSAYDYTDCVEECIKNIDIEDIDRYDAHIWGCILNETIEETEETICY